MGGDELAVEDVLLVVAAEEEEAVDAPEVAVDVLEPNDLLDAVDRGHVALDNEPGVLGAVDLLEVVDAVVHRPREVGGRTSGLAAADRAVVDYHHFFAGFCEVVGGGEVQPAPARDRLHRERCVARADLFEDPHLRARGYFLQSEEPGAGVQPLFGLSPLSAMPGYFDRPSPRLGEHTREILEGELGYSAADVAELVANGVVTQLAPAAREEAVS